MDLKTAVIKGLPADNGLFMPQTIPTLSKNFINSLHNKSLAEIAFEVSSAFFADDLMPKQIKAIADEAINFDTPLVPIEKDIFALELFHGPTLAFKDVGARFMSRLLSQLLEKQEQEVDILVATSGDTGSAVAQGFYGVEGIHVTILYPSGKVSRSQEQQIATLDKNITTLEVDGTFDDCQKLVKQAFLDKELNEECRLSSANSINIARFLPQSFYYFRAVGQLMHRYEKPAVFSVPSGNFGNLTAGVFAQRMGLPIAHFIAAVNANDSYPRYLKNGVFTAQASVQTISNAMDVGNPSNLGRIIDLFEGDVAQLAKVIPSYSFDDEQTRATLKAVYERSGYLLDPHGAVGFAAVEKQRALSGESHPAIVFETAHPAKFSETVNPLIAKEVAIPKRLALFMNRTKNAKRLSKNYDDFKSYLLSR